MPPENIIPLISVGMPVYNGAKTLQRAIDSILSQDYTNFELIISDNASTDETAEICCNYILKDKRVCYYRANSNMGGAWNFNRVVELSKGKYFMRMSHDDFRAPVYISKCVSLLEANPNAVLCHSYTAAFYGERTNILMITTLDTIQEISSSKKRFIDALKYLPATSIDGLIRSETLKTKIRQMGNYLSSDIVLTHELCLYGEFVQVPEILFWRSGKAVLPPPQAVYPVYGIGKKISKLYFPFLRVALNHFKSVCRAPLTKTIKLSLFARITLHEIKTISVKALFRTVMALFAENCPNFLIRFFILQTDNNPNVCLLKSSLELPPALQPMWKLLNHRNLQKAENLQKKLIENFFKNEPTIGIGKKGQNKNE